VENIKVQSLGILVKERLDDAKALYRAERYSGAMYMCGYALELGLKKKTCQTLDWDEYPTNEKHKTLKTHKLEVLLHFSGVEKVVSTKLSAEWSIVLRWNPDNRYSAAMVTEVDAKLIIDSIETILSSL